MYDNDENFGCIVVKKTLEECNDLRLDLGLDKTKTNDLQNEIDLNNERSYKASVIRGFNFKDCTKYVAKSKGWGKQINEASYDYRLCKECCHRECPVRQSKKDCQKHRIILISHQRLFSSTENEALINDLLYFENSQGELIKRQLLIIDEKLDTIDIGSITYKEFSSLKSKVVKSNNTELIELIQKIDCYLINLVYPLQINSKILPQKCVYLENFMFSDSLMGLILKDKTTTLEEIRQICALQKILSSSNISTSINYPSKDRQVSYFNYIDLSQYAKNFDKTVILDATARLDIDYLKSNVKFCENIQHEKPSINLVCPKHKFKITKTNIAGKNIEFNSSVEREKFYENNVQLLGKELFNIINSKLQGETLIVVFKSINNNNFREDINNELKQLQPNHNYKIIHHGEFSTGVNHLSRYENIIILGQLNKSHIYYQNKCLALGFDLSVYEDVQVKDYLIQNIQQIGRTAYRNGKQVNVVMLCNEPNLIEHMKQYFNVQQSIYECTSYKSELTAVEKVMDAVNEVLINQGDIVLKKDIYTKADVDESTLRKPYVKGALEEIGIVTKEGSNRYLVKL